MILDLDQATTVSSAFGTLEDQAGYCMAVSFLTLERRIKVWTGTTTIFVSATTRNSVPVEIFNERYTSLQSFRRAYRLV